jgi:hypothetical protein
MARRRTRKQVGQTTFLDTEAGTVSHSREEVELHPDRAVIRIGPLDPQQPARVVETRDRGAVRYTRSVVEARQAHARRVEPVTPDFKPTRSRKSKVSSAACPECGGSGEVDTGEELIACRACNGTQPN